MTSGIGVVRPVLAAFSIACLSVLAACSAASNHGASAASSAASSASPTARSVATTGSATRTSVPATSAAPTAKPVPVESNPPGDIPDNLAFVRYANGPGHYSFTHPEGWARTGSGTAVVFTDKLNGVAAESLAANQAPTVATARSQDVPRLRRSVPAFQLRSITGVSLPAGRGTHIVFRRNSDPNPVTGKVYRDEVEEYDVFSAGHLVRLDLFGPVGADNVDAYRTMAQSLRLR